MTSVSKMHMLSIGGTGAWAKSLCDRRMPLNRVTVALSEVTCDTCLELKRKERLDRPGHGRTAIYYRVSTDQQQTESQKNAIERWLQSVPYESAPTEVRVFEDVASGKKQRRPALDTLMAACRRGEIDTLVVYKLDRVARTTKMAVHLILELEELGIAFVSVSQPVFSMPHDNPFRKTILVAFAELAQVEREMIVARVTEGLRAAQARGVRLGRPFKYSRRVVEEVFRLRADGLSLRKIGRLTKIGSSSVDWILNNRYGNYSELKPEEMDS